MAPTQQTPLTAASSGSCNCKDAAPSYEYRAVHTYDERLTEQNEDLDWAIDVLSPNSQADVWQRSAATNVLIVLTKYGATQHIRHVAGNVLGNGIGGLA